MQHKNLCGSVGIQLDATHATDDKMYDNALTSASTAMNSRVDEQTGLSDNITNDDWRNDGKKPY